ncbi:MAG TPA: OsmC family protein [Miltoncostaeaceae bacterium]|nr:OsmC family protein [Miltoncostaeaceae bacterium]
MTEPTFTTRVRVTRERPPLRTAELRETGETVTFGTPGYQGDFYDLGEGELREHGGTFDYLVAAVAACLMGTLGRALAVRGIPSDGDRLLSEAEGHVVVENNIMVMRRISIRYRLRLDDPDQREAAERAHAHHVRACGVALSVMPSLAIETELTTVPAAQVA